MRDRGVLTRLLDDGGCACPRMPLSERCAASHLVATAGPFVGSDEDGRRTAGMYALVETAKLNDINPREWLAYVLARLRGPG
jgi:transposase